MCTGLPTLSIRFTYQQFLKVVHISEREMYETNIYYVEIKCQLDVTAVSIADLIACSTCFGHHCAHRQELKSITQWLLPVVFRPVVFQVAGLVWS